MTIATTRGMTSSMKALVLGILVASVGAPAYAESIMPASYSVRGASMNPFPLKFVSARPPKFSAPHHYVVRMNPDTGKTMTLGFTKSRDAAGRLKLELQSAQNF